MRNSEQKMNAVMADGHVDFPGIKETRKNAMRIRHAGDNLKRTLIFVHPIEHIFFLAA